MMVLMKRVTMTLSYFGSATLSRRAMNPLRGIAQLPQCGDRPPRVALLRLRTVLGTTLLAPADAAGVERAAHDVIPHARQILYATAANEHDRVLLQIVPLAGDVGGDLDAVREPHARHLPQRGVRLLRRGRVDPGAHAPL